MAEDRAYSLGDSKLAAERLALLARVFEPAMRSFLEQAAPRRPRLALDLGCGPGYTTETVAALTRPERMVGLDTSERFLQYAQTRAGSRIEFVQHDVTLTPFPARPADLIFARLLLSHLPEPEKQVARLVGELAPDGVFLSDEVERIETKLKRFAHYLALVERRMRESGGELYLGPRLDALRGGTSFRQRSSYLARVSPPTADAAAMGLFNLRVMRRAGRLDGLASPTELDRLERELGELTQSTAGGEIVWSLRQTVFSPA